MWFISCYTFSLSSFSSVVRLCNGHSCILRWHKKDLTCGWVSFQKSSCNVFLCFYIAILCYTFTLLYFESTVFGICDATGSTLNHYHPKSYQIVVYSIQVDPKFLESNQIDLNPFQNGQSFRSMQRDFMSERGVCLIDSTWYSSGIENWCDQCVLIW